MLAEKSYSDEKERQCENEYRESQIPPSQMEKYCGDTGHASWCKLRRIEEDRNRKCCDSGSDNNISIINDVSCSVCHFLDLYAFQLMLSIAVHAFG